MAFESIDVWLECDECGETDDFEASVSGGRLALSGFEDSGWYARAGDKHFCPDCALDAKLEDGVESDDEADAWDDDDDPDLDD